MSKKQIDYGHSVFTMDNVNHVVAMGVNEAKVYCHQLVDASTANNKNRANIKRLIDQQRDSAGLAKMMTNHILAHPSEGLKVLND